MRINNDLTERYLTFFSDLIRYSPCCLTVIDDIIFTFIVSVLLPYNNSVNNTMIILLFTLILAFIIFVLTLIHLYN